MHIATQAQEKTKTPQVVKRYQFKLRFGRTSEKSDGADSAGLVTSTTNLD